MPNDTFLYLHLIEPSLCGDSTSLVVPSGVIQTKRVILDIPDL